MIKPIRKKGGKKGGSKNGVLWDKNIPVTHIDDFVDECIACKHNVDPKYILC